jgi:hypothetical protein
MSNTRVYFVPLIDVTWASFAPLDEQRGFPTGPLSLELCRKESEQSLDFMTQVTGGRYVYAVHTGTYCRTAFYEEPFLSIWREGAARGAEFVVHPHEEIAGKGTLYGDRSHMKRVTSEAIRLMREGGIEPVGYRGGHYGYGSFMTELLQELKLPLDFSAAPGFNRPDWEAQWGNAPFTAYYPAPGAPSTPAPKGAVLEVPLGADGKGADNGNLLYLDYDQASAESLQKIWDTIAARADDSGRPQIIHTLYHTISMSSPQMRDRFRKFVDYAQAHGGEMVKPSQVKSLLA